MAQDQESCTTKSESQTSTKRVTRSRKGPTKCTSEKAKTRSSARLLSKDKDSNQKSINDFITSSSSGSPLSTPPITPPTVDKFDFKLTAALPSEADASITQYQAAGSPHGTPTKRSGISLSKASQVKRKRKSLETTFSELPVVNDFPSSPPSPVSASTAVTQTEQDLGASLFSVSPSLEHKWVLFVLILIHLL